MKHIASIYNLLNTSIIACATWLVGAVALVSCSHQDNIAPETTGCAIAFSTTAQAPSRDGSGLEDSYESFVVYGHKWLDGDSQGQTVFPSYIVSFDNGAWSYESESPLQYLKYWDLSAGKYLFSAVSPVPDNSETAAVAWKNTTVNISTGGDISINGIIGNVSTGDYTNSSHSPDWMVAKTKRVASPLADTDLINNTLLHSANSPINAFTDDVPLRFHHIMAKVDFLAWSTSPVILKSFKVDVEDGQEIISQANWSTTGGWTDKVALEAMDPLVYCNYTFLDGKTLSTESDYPTLLSSHVQIPQEWASDGRRLNVTFTTTDNKVYKGTITIDANTNKTNSWIQETQYRYTIKIDTGSASSEVILFSIDMNAWKWLEGNDIDTEQYNW